MDPKIGKKKSKRDPNSPYSSSSGETVAPRPTLQIKKREGTYWVTMNPLKDPCGLEDNENPYIDCNPMQFKITKADRQCICSDDESESSDSELDIEFTPPAGVIRPERLRKKKNVVHIDTQYDTKDFTPQPPKGKGKGGKGKGKKK